MRGILLFAVLLLALAGSSYATGIRTAEPGITPSENRFARDGCVLSYHNFCSGWVYWWTGYNGTEFADLAGMELPPAQVGICFDLRDCGLGCGECQNLSGVSWAWRKLDSYGRLDVEVYCADSACCPVGAPLAGFYDFDIDTNTAWQYFPFDDLLLPCPECKFIVMATIRTPGGCVPFSDTSDRNTETGCEAWRCTGHSYCYRNVVDYCDAYGYPGPMLVDYSGACPPDDALHVDWLAYAYVGCYGPTAAEGKSWSEIKSLYR